MVRFSFAGHAFDALAEGALWWPEHRMLLVADLHFEKASFYANHGQLLPPYDTEATLVAVEALARRHDPDEIVCLGDSFHDRGGCDRLPQAARDRLRALTAAVRWTWIAGNHDAGARIADHCGGELADERVVDGVVLRHIADPADPRPELSGHFHPRLSLTLRGRRVVRRCFVASATKLVLPALGTLTGGLNAADPAIRRALGGTGHALVPVAERMLRFPLAA